MKYSPYCPICGACGESGCCRPTMCKQSPDGDYCASYLEELKNEYILLGKLLDKIYELDIKELISIIDENT